MAIKCVISYPGSHDITVGIDCNKVTLPKVSLRRAIGIWVVLVSGAIFLRLITGMALLGVGTAFVYPTLFAAISDIANPRWRATALGVYRFWRDLGFVFGAIGIGFIADITSLSTAIQIVAWISLGSGIFVLVFMRETR